MVATAFTDDGISCEAGVKVGAGMGTGTGLGGLQQPPTAGPLPMSHSTISATVKAIAPIQRQVGQMGQVGRTFWVELGMSRAA